MMVRMTFKILTFAIMLSALLVNAEILEQQEFDTHLRWAISTSQANIEIEKNPKYAVLKTMNVNVLEEILTDITKRNPSKRYISDIQFSKEGFPQTPATLTITYKDQSIELFSFYQGRESKHVLDFWINPDLAPKSAAKKPEVVADIESTKKEEMPVVSSPKIVKSVKPVIAVKEKEKEAPKSDTVPKKSAPVSIESAIDASKVVVDTSSERSNNVGFRDFRYGAALLWNYEPFMPEVDGDIDLHSKTVDSVYPIRDRKLKGDQKEAHLQLSINFFRQEKWGFMNKSIRIYQEKYGVDSNYEINEFLKANALLKSNIRSKEKNKSIVNSAINILESIIAKTDDYELKRAILRYVIQYSIDNKNYVKSLQMGKDLFALARENFDPEMKTRGAKVILFSLGKLEQSDQIEQFLQDKYASSLVAPQVAIAYKFAIKLINNDPKSIINEYEKIQKDLVKPIHASLLYSVAEAYFRLGDYEKALAKYDEFSNEYSYIHQASHARLRIAQCYDLLDKDITKVIALYERAMNRSGDSQVRYEAKLRYAAIFLNRKMNPTPEDLEKEIYLEYSDDEKSVINNNLKQSLWLVRLRLYLNKGEYSNALTYLSGIPLASFNPSTRITFELDGSEAIYGMMKKSVEESDYASAIKVWEIFKDKYGDRLGVNSHLHYIYAQSLLQVGLFDRFNSELGIWGKTINSERNFPVWVGRVELADKTALVKEMNWRKMLKNGEFEALIKDVDQVGNDYAGMVPSAYYKGIAQFQLKKYGEATEELESVIVNPKSMEHLLQDDKGDLLAAYSESLYASGNIERFKSVAEAIIKDLNKNAGAKAVKTKEIAKRISYLLIESTAGAKSPDYKELEKQTATFLEAYNKSEYDKRVRYLRGISYIKNSRIKEGKTELGKLLQDEATPNYLKKLVQSELAALELRGKNL